MSEYIVNAANGLNGRVAPEPDAEVGAVRADGDRIVGELEGEWVAGEDGLFYRAEYLTVLMTEHDDDQDADQDADPEADDHGRSDTQ